MNTLIHKQVMNIRNADRQKRMFEFRLPVNAKILKIAIQENDVCFWYAFDYNEFGENEKESRKILMQLTGEEYSYLNSADLAGIYIDTIFYPNGEVLHFFILNKE